MSRFGIEKLDVWQKAISLASAIYEVTKRFPNDERFGLTGQLRRAATSVPANIAEGSGRQSKKDFQRFLAHAYGSLMEIVSHLHIAKTQGYLSEEQLDELLNAIQTIAKMISGLKRSLD